MSVIKSEGWVSKLNRYGVDRIVATVMLIMVLMALSVQYFA